MVFYIADFLWGAIMQRDYLDALGASNLADRIREYWRRLGLKPKVWCEPLFFSEKLAPKDGAVYVVRSDMLSGSPR